MDQTERTGVWHVLWIHAEAESGSTRRALARSPESATRDFARTMTDFPVALATSEANEQHYEIPAAFFQQILGHRYKYSCCYFENADTSLDDAEDRANHAVVALDRALAGAGVVGVGEVLPALVNLLVEFDPVVTDHVEVEAAVACAAAAG